MHVFAKAAREAEHGARSQLLAVLPKCPPPPPPPRRVIDLEVKDEEEGGGAAASASSGGVPRAGGSGTAP